jgi:uncharacterized protein (TIGR03086 family)
VPPQLLEPYRRALDGFDEVVAAVPADRWHAPSACALWTVRDVAGHVIWGQHQLRHWATGEEYTCGEGAPGAPHPGAMAGTDHVATWRAARAACDRTLTEEALDRPVVLPGLGAQPLAAIVTLLVTDLLAHAWDIGHGLGVGVRLDADLIPGSLAWARQNVIRMPGFFGPELEPPPDADEQTRWLAYLGRAAWQPVPA